RVVRKLDLSISYLAIGKLKNENIYKYGPFRLEAFQVFDSSRSFSMTIRPNRNETFTVNGENKQFAYGELFKNNNGVFRLIRNPVGYGKEYNISWRPPSSIAGDLAAKLQVVPKTVGTGILTLSIEGTNPRMCADIIDQLMVEYQLQDIDEK